MFKNLLRTKGPSRPRQNGQAPFPAQQLFVLALCRICEPIAFMSIFPYIYFMIESFHITQDDRKIAIYAGMVTSSFAFAEFSTGVVWGRLSDRIGRKPVLIMGLVGTGLSMILFGFASSLPVALLARALGGLLNGNVGVLQTTVAEMITVKEHQPRAYSIMPFVWCLGSIMGPALGGALARPCEAYPWLFAKNTIFDRYPFLLPNLVCVFVVVCGVFNGILFLDETHAEKKHRRDIGREFGDWILRRPFNSKSPERLPEYSAIQQDADFSLVIFENEQPPGYRTTEGSPRISTTTPPPPSTAACKVEERIPPSSRPCGMNKAFNKQVIFNIIGYGILAYHSVSFDQLMPVFLSAPVSTVEPRLPFKFTGGFSLSTKTIGAMLAIQGIYSMIAQLWLFPYVVRRFGTLATFRFVIMIWPALYFIVPYTVLLPKKLQMPSVYFCLIAKITLHVLAFPSNAIMLTNSAPSLLVLGVINGIAASTASLSRGFGPTITGLVHTAGLKAGYNGLGWWVSGFICFVGAIQSLWMEEGKGRLDESPNDDEETLPCLVSPQIETNILVEDTNLFSRESIDPFELKPVMSATDVKA